MTADVKTPSILKPRADQRRCMECGGWTSDPEWHERSYQHRFRPAAAIQG